MIEFRWLLLILFSVLFPRHTCKASRDNTINLIHIFRDYLHYHIKCSKAYIHSRMRAKTSDFLKVLNRARPEPKNLERKTAGYVKVWKEMKQLTDIFVCFRGRSFHHMTGNWDFVSPLRASVIHASPNQPKGPWKCLLIN